MFTIGVDFGTNSGAGARRGLIRLSGRSASVRLIRARFFGSSTPSGAIGSSARALSRPRFLLV